MSAARGRGPTKTELQAYALGKLDPSRRADVEAYIKAHPECLADLASAGEDEVVRHLRGAKEVPVPPRLSLLELAIEAVMPVVAGCAGAIAGGVEGGLVGVIAGQVAEKAINVFGGRIVNKWQEWLRRQPPAVQTAAVVELAEVPAEVIRSRVAAILAREVPQASQADRRTVADYLSAIPRAVRHSMLSDPGSGRTLLPSVSVDDSVSLLQLLPTSLPPYPTPFQLPGTTYQLEEIIGCGGFGAVYRASNADMQYLPLAIKFCLDRSLVALLERERENLDRLKEAGQAWSPRIVRLYGYNLEHATPYLVYEYVAGGDLVHWLSRRRARMGRELTPAEVLGVIVQVVEALAFAHERGIVHRDLKPANVLIEDEMGKVKLGDFGIGGVAQTLGQTSRVGTVASGALNAAEQASLFRGAGTPLYMDPEQREGKVADPRHDLHSLGVMWYQLLVGDVRREMRHGWERELKRKHEVPREQVELIGRCVGWIDERLVDARALMQLVQKAAKTVETVEPANEQKSGTIAKPAELSNPEVVTATGNEMPKSVTREEAHNWRAEVVKATSALEKVEIATPSLLGRIACAATVLFSIAFYGMGLCVFPDHLLTEFGPLALWTCILLFIISVVLGLLIFSSFVKRQTSRRTRAAAASSAIKSAQENLSLPPVLHDSDNNKSLCQAGWQVVRGIAKRYLPCGARARIRVRWAGSTSETDLRAIVYLNGTEIGEAPFRHDFNLSVDGLCPGHHFLAVRVLQGSSEWTSSGLLHISDEDSHHIEAAVMCWRNLKIRVN